MGRRVRVIKRVEEIKEDDAVGRLDESVEDDEQRWSEASIGRTNEQTQGAHVVAGTPAP
jgi:hypothetical protein